MNEQLGSIFQALDIESTNGLASDDNKKMTIFQHYFFSQVKEKLQLDAVFFLRDHSGTPQIPLIYFSAMDTYNPNAIAELHRLAWNTGGAPLLFVVTPDQLLVFDNYSKPNRCSDGRYDIEAGLIDKISLLSDLEKQRRLPKYSRVNIETGALWKEYPKRFNIKTRVDSTLMSNLRVIRKTLLNNIKKRHANIDNQLHVEIVHALLGRSILIKYLEERTDSNGNSVFPSDFFARYKANAERYTDVLQDKNATYTLFSDLEEKFNGDMLQLCAYETEIVQHEDLLELRSFLLGDSDLASQQMVLWPLYTFNVIPIQLISSIYELFFHLSDVEPSKEKGTYYTPLHLVEMLMDEVLPWTAPFQQKKILDPACGSGIFLVAAYRRLICQWMDSNIKTIIRPNDLQDILEKCIFGIDCNEEAIRIASFSLSLVMCDFLEPREIWDNLKFSRLRYFNLFPFDFFDRDKEFEKKEFDIVIGNPPWESRMSPAADQYIKDTRYPIGDKQIAQAFTWRAIDICPNGKICLLLPSKPFLFNRWPTTIKYRRKFFAQCDVSVIINFSVFRRVLFEHATGPAVAVVYHAKKSGMRSEIFYCSPKPLYDIEDSIRFLIEPNDICRIPAESANDDLIWKIAMWGSPRDMDLVYSIRSMHKDLQSILKEYGMVHAEGFKRGNRKSTCDDFIDWPLIDTGNFLPGKNEEELLPRVNFTDFECVVKKNRAVFSAPHLMIKQSHKNARFLADVLNYDAVFNHSFLGVHGDERILKYLCLMISSKVFSYYQLMTNRKWMVERDELEAGDILAAPIPYPSEQAIGEAEVLFEKVLGESTEISEIDSFAYRQYRLEDHEITMMTEAIDHVYDYFNRKGKSKSLQIPTVDMLEIYTESLCAVLKNSLGHAFPISCCVYFGDAPLLVTVLDLSADKNPKFSFKTNRHDIDRLLYELDKQLLDARSESVFVKRNVRIYNKDSIYIIKPKQVRYWNTSSAYRDADGIYADVMRAWRGEDE